MSLKSLISLPLKEAQLLLQSELKIPNFKCWKLKKPSRFSSFSIRARFFCDYIRDRYDSKLESAINQQINAELNAGYAYLNIATYYGRSDVAMPGLHGFFMKMFYEELEHGLAFVKFQNLRGGCVQYCPLETHKKSEWKDIPAVFMTALSMEKHVKGVRYRSILLRSRSTLDFIAFFSYCWLYMVVHHKQTM